MQAIFSDLSCSLLQQCYSSAPKQYNEDHFEAFSVCSNVVRYFPLYVEYFMPIACGTVLHPKDIVLESLYSVQFIFLFHRKKRKDRLICDLVYFPCVHCVNVVAYMT